MATETVGYLLGAGARPLPVIKGAVVTFGREGRNTVVVDDAMVSRNHASIDCQQDAAMIKDLGSRNGTLLNGTRLAADAPCALHGGDEIRIGGKMFYFISATAGLEPSQAAMKHASYFSQMETIGFDGEVRVEGGKVIERKWPADQTRSLPRVGEGVSASGRGALAATVSGSLTEGGLPQILQFIHASAMSGKLQVQGTRLSCSILFLDGELHSASTAEASGVEAIYACALESAGSFSFVPLGEARILRIPKDIADNTMMVILECCRRMDALSSPAKT